MFLLKFNSLSCQFQGTKLIHSFVFVLNGAPAIDDGIEPLKLIMKFGSVGIDMEMTYSQGCGFNFYCQCENLFDT